MADKILSQMALFDFNAPMKTIMIFGEDSDEENQCTTPKKQKNKTSENTSSPSHVVDLINSSDDEVYPQKGVLSVIQNDKVPADRRAKSIQVEIAKANENISTDSSTLQTENIAVFDKTIDNNCNEGNRNVSEKPVHEQGKVNTMSDDMKVMADYLKKLLNTVSLNLLMIIREYSNHLEIKNTGNEISIEKSKIRYSHVRQHFLKLSFNVVETIFIPQVHSYTFARNFIECTVRIGKRVSMNYTYEQIVPHYLEMIQWTKEKSKDFKQFCSSVINSKQPFINNTNNLFTGVTNHNVQNVHPQTVPQMSRYKNINITPELQRQIGVPNQSQPQHPIMSSMLPSLPSYNDAVNLQRNITFELNNYSYNNCQSQHNYDTPQGHQSCGSYPCNHMTNAHVSGIPYIPNGPSALQNRAPHQNIQHKNGIPQQIVNISNVSQCLEPYCSTIR